jgi:transcription-repair coupling factor (superfamily II helicase)
VRVALDFLAMSPAEEGAVETRSAERGTRKEADDDWQISVPRETATYESWDAEDDRKAKAQSSKPAIVRAPAYVPLGYVPEAQQRIEIYRKLAQATDKTGLEALGREIRDRYGALPDGVDLLLQTYELKLIAAEKGITAIETRDDKLMLSRRGDYVMFGGKFPRLTKPDAQGRLKEIKKLMLAM